MLELAFLLITSRSVVEQPNNDNKQPLVSVQLMPADEDQAGRCSNTYTNFLNKRDENDNPDLSLTDRCFIIMAVLDYIEELENDASCDLSGTLRSNRQDALNHRSVQCDFFHENWCGYFGMKQHCTCAPYSNDCV